MAGNPYKGAMLNALLRLLLAAGAFLAADYVLPGFQVKGLVVSLEAAVVLGILNAVVRPIIGFFAWPITCLTVGLFSLVINGLMLALVQAIIKGVHFDNFLWAIAAALVISLVNGLGSFFLK